MEGRKIDRSQLFGDDNSQGASDMDEEDFETFEKMMEARIKVQDHHTQQQQQQQQQYDEQGEEDEAQEQEITDAEQTSAPVFKLFAGSNLVKVETEVAEPKYVAPQRPEAQLEESDSEEHRSALLAAAIDADTIHAMSKVPLPALQYPKRVIHLKADGSSNSPMDSAKNPEKTKPKSKARCKKRKAQEHKRALKRQKAPLPYERCVRSLFTGGMLKGKMLEDVIRDEKAAADARMRRVASSRGGHGVGRGGFRGRGRGRGHSGGFGTGRPVASIGSRFSN
ncbi:hypothetical protein IW140_000235 [Coemansia sp. RSA 1813]|nr:hypothetical protein EV178_000438 [Coemansia sp. RSA 1646]KAJ1773791.1 hypothetical protein LPJ74_000335 [Coemansia sp. RSA 1843]KAJ2093754.1 hypothetical protein IW138_000150 [Coemansia sp. RSA 986]KAJ2217965.1 hypothetical protein EV179_000110 [Coemansia sp. RSA 487]KAJ2573192.1 hypothetical protein IW140_000235 [Coemansia sp. RSA 1813]